MESKAYHHGNLKNSLIEAGIKLINREGFSSFSLRKVAAICNVSHAAPYKHFKNKDELVDAIMEYVNIRFSEALIEVIKQYNDPYQQIIKLGRAYVCFMVENPDYFEFLFLGTLKHNVQIDAYNQAGYFSQPFNIFKNSAINYLKSINVKKEDFTDNITAMWAMVHGLSVMFVNRTVVYDTNSLDLVEKILSQKLNLR